MHGICMSQRMCEDGRVTLRDRQTEAARKLILDAALQQFLVGGFVATTMDEIAVAAGVARRTVYNQFGSKAALLIAVVDDRVAGQEVRSQSDDRAAVFAIEDPREMIHAFVRSHLGVVERTLPVLGLVMEASAVDGEVAKEFEKMEDVRLEAQGSFVDVMASKGFLRSDAPRTDLRRGFWLLASPRMAIMSRDAGWDLETYGWWLEHSMAGLLLAG